MSLVQPPGPERRPSPSLELGTNNPFRARLSGIVPNSPASPSDSFSYASSGNGRPVSRNPFLDVFDDDDLSRPSDQGRFAHRASSFDSSQKPNGHQLSGSAAELFENLTVTDHSDDPFAAMDRPKDKGGMRPPPPRPQPRRPPPPGHHHSASARDEPQLISLADEPRKPAPRRGPPPSGYNDRPRDRDRDRDRSRGDRDRDRERRRPRRNSDSSVMDAHDAERDYARRERRTKDKSSRENGKEKSTDKRKKNPALDVIDKLDVTGIYGPGLFHHDGPFDACNPHRNKSTRRLAPVQAFPEDSANNSMSGSGPLNMRPDHAQVFGNREPEAFNDYTHMVRPAGKRAESFDPKRAADAIHGDESSGLGTSTFLDGAPAPKAAIARAMYETEERPSTSEGGGFGGGGLQRKKSLAQKIRGMGGKNSISGSYGGDGGMGGRRRAPPPPGQRSPPEDRYSPTTPVDGHMVRGGEKNPFFNEYGDGKGESITVIERRDTAPSNTKLPSPGLERVGTDRSNNENGLLKRVRSLSKPKRRND